MKEEIVNQLAEFGSKLITLVDAGVDFASEQVPIFLIEALKYWTAMSIFTVLLLTIITIGLVIVGVKSLKFSNKISNYGSYDGKEHDKLYKLYVGDSNALFTLLGIISLAGSIGTFIGWCVSMSNLFKIYLAPRLYLLEKLAEMFNK